MRTISSTSLAQLAQNLGTKPVNIIEIQWIDSAPRLAYSDKTLPGIPGKILTIDGIDSIIQITGASDSNQVNVVLDDIDSEIKNLFDTTDATKRPVWVYQWFEGTALSEKFLIFRGEIRSPLTWDEGARTVSFSVVEKIEDAEVGFSIEEGNFPQPPDELIGQPWPIAFGTVCDVKALQARTSRQGILKSGVGISDFTLPNRICQAGYILCPVEPKGTTSTLSPKSPTADKFGMVTTPVAGASQTCADNRCQTIQELKFALAQQISYEYTTITVIDGELFPQGTLITLNIDGAKFTGTFSGEIFTIVSRQHPQFYAPDTSVPNFSESNNPSPIPGTSPPEYPKYHNPDGSPIPALVCRQISAAAYVQAPTCTANFARLGDGNTFQSSSTDCVDCTELAPVLDGGAVASQKAYDEMPTSAFFWAPSGSKVTLDGEEEILYIANLLPATINRVSAFRSLATGQTLMTVPESMYDIFHTNYGGYTVTELHFPVLPSLVPNPLNGQIDGKWGNDIYVSMTSSVGPNTVDILQYLIEKYTSFAIDSTTFNHVRTRLENYPSNFAILARPNIVQTLQEIAHQARCALLLRDNTFFIVYLSEEPTSVATITESDIIANSLQVVHTDTENLTTKYIAKWKKDGVREYDNEGHLLTTAQQARVDQIILRHNIKKYGTQENTTNYYIYNIRENVLKSATFWLIRESNSWRRAVFSTTIKHLALEIFDCVTLDLPDVAPNPIKAIVEKATYDSQNHLIQFECWTPLLAGTGTPYLWAWPADQLAGAEFPTQDEIDAGLAGSGDTDGYIMVPPPGSLLAAQTIPGDNRADWGDRFPSDLDDSFITVDCPAGADVDLNDETAPALKAFVRAANAAAQANTNAGNAGAGTGGSNQNKKKDKSGLCGQPADTSPAGCSYSVTASYIRVGSVFRLGDGAVSTSGIGKYRTGTFTSTMCHIFGSLFAQQAMIKYLQAQWNAVENTVACGGDYVYGPSVGNSGSAGSGDGLESCAQLDTKQGSNPNAKRDPEKAAYASSQADLPVPGGATIPAGDFFASSSPEGETITNTFVPNNPVI
jgi:hypothetical protein